MAVRMLHMPRRSKTERERERSFCDSVQYGSVACGAVHMCHARVYTEQHICSFCVLGCAAC